jgi:hypothetical protein
LGQQIGDRTIGHKGPATFPSAAAVFEVFHGNANASDPASDQAHGAKGQDFQPAAMSAIAIAHLAFVVISPLMRCDNLQCLQHWQGIFCCRDLWPHPSPPQSDDTIIILLLPLCSLLVAIDCNWPQHCPPQHVEAPAKMPMMVH